MKLSRFSRITPALLLINALLLVYTAWLKYNGDACPSCNDLSSFEINGIYIASVGAFASLVLAGLYIATSFRKGLKLLLFILSAVFASLASYLQVIQFYSADDYCYFCLAAAVLFYIAFCAISFEVLIMPRLLIAMKTTTSEA
ncbi:MAG: hypothetical protein COW32_08360 [Candidatus Aquicultor secundus]|uniref:Vitamin K epoxide reductase domain-containing protein n=2 Tax=Candidatus Aquicultor secundus TaxID=1973895 RepID=A0A2M7T7G0_9ACTN|nr:hypothetical protein [Candidatus Aquicultor secundus]NCO66821.1 hypothetical protein [Solirubrobacter sp.]OIO85476.1 MAG: hypothetical protein AUK32_07155 [Candidatus Aquicultor secundus]PIU27722.1 MAG: hypothetical protein COT10_01990 [Candidatus Aquicultor secundus]PIW21733.1 MAG: hypothetical protein COW32_08360 [Candidatus Aquicultor secundus]PIX52433.1 MAG: hypothetical protein COZ51_04215 [Candidatus Aquicultor secundus]